MAKNTAAPATDLANAMSFVATRASATPPAAPAEAPAPVSTPEAAPASPKSTTDSQATTGKKEAGPPEAFDYASAFLTPVRTRKTKAIYVDEPLHTALSVLTQVAGVGLADLLINIANDHFERYRPAIQKYMSDQEKLRKKQLPY